MPSRRSVLRGFVIGAASTAVAGLGAVLWSRTLIGEHSVLTMGGHPMGGMRGLAGGPVSVETLTADPHRAADVRVRLTARREHIRIRGGRTVDGFTVNGASPGPVLRARQGQLVEVELVNETVSDGATLHWHGVEVPCAADGVAGVTQNAVRPGETFLYRFVATHPGTYWYHSHQVSHEQVVGGLLGAVVIESDADPAPMVTTDVVAVLHLYDGQHTLNGEVADLPVTAAPGATARVRVVNTDNGSASVWSAASFRVVAVDGREWHEPGDVSGRMVVVPAGGRADIVLTAPETGAVRLHTGGALSVILGDPATTPVRAEQPSEALDLLAYGTPAPLGFDPQRANRTFDYIIGRRVGFIDGRPGWFWTINGRMYPDVPMFEVAEGDVVRMRIRNDSSEVHPMHLHGHHVAVLSRDGRVATGAPWWADTIGVQPGESYEIAFVADNPGIWADHCHDLPHAVDGLIAHLAYAGVTTPFLMDGSSANRPE
ncbi:MAG: multicopper oxidase family protein [Actinobacteria bacterium]|nr:multicopper oxidase family protein [Actinomycetota bacterium]